MGALRDFERLARDFVSDLRTVACDSGSIFGTEVIPTLRDILSDTLDRIREEVFDLRHEGTAGTAEGGAGSEAARGESARGESARGGSARDRSADADRTAQQPPTETPTELSSGLALTAQSSGAP
jgi:hypothetical protein